MGIGQIESMENRGCFLLPYLIVFLVFRFGPSVAGLFIGFLDWNIVGQASFDGLNNFKKIFTDPFFRISLKNTLLFLVYVLPPLVVFSLLIAVLLNQKLRFRNVVRTTSIIPYVLVPAVVGIIWNWLYENNFGILNYYLKSVGLSPVEWLTNEKWALLSIAIVTIWSYLGYNMILYLAGLQEIPLDLYEAMVAIRDNRLKPLTVGIAQFLGGANSTAQFQYGTSLAAACMAIIPSVILFLMLQRYFVEGIANTGIKG